MAEIRRTIRAIRTNEDGSQKEILLSPETAKKSRYLQKYNIRIIDPNFKPIAPKVTSRPIVDSIDEMPDMNDAPEFASTEDKPARAKRTPKS